MRVITPRAHATEGGAVLILLGPLRFWELRDDGTAVFNAYGELAPDDTITLDSSRILDALVDDKGYHYIVYDAGDREFDSLKPFSAEWPRGARRVEELHVKVLTGSMCDDEFIKGRLVDDTSCVPVYHESRMRVERREYDRGEVYARSPTPADIITWRAVTGRNVREVVGWLMGRSDVHGGPGVQCDDLGCWETSDYEGPVPAEVVAAKRLAPPFAALVAARSHYEYGEGRSRLVERPIVILYYYRGSRLYASARLAVSVDEARRLFEGIAGRLGPYVEGDGLASEVEVLARDAREQWERVGRLRALASKTPRWAVGVVVLRTSDGRYAAYPVKKRGGRLYFRVTWRPVEEGEHLAELENRLVRRDGRAEEVWWLQRGEWVNILDLDEALQYGIKRVERMMRGGVEVRTRRGRVAEA